MTQEEITENEELKRAKALLEEGRHDSCLKVIRAYWLDNPKDIHAIKILRDLLKQADQDEIANSLDILLAQKKSDDENICDLNSIPEKVFETGYKFIDIREFELAEMLLKICASQAPDDPGVHYELAFAMMAQAKYELAARHFELVRKIEEDFDTVLNLSACYSLAREFKRSKEMIKKLEKLATTDEERYELKHRRNVLKRQEQLKKKKVLTTRDWLFILYGSLLLFDDSEEDDDGNQSQDLDFKPESEPIKKIACTLVVLKGVLEGLRLAPEAIEFYSITARPLSAILARLFDIPLSAYKGPDRPDHALMLMDWAPEIIGPHKSFVPNDKNRSTFAYGIPSNMPLPIVPDIIGHYKDAILLPWKGESQATLNEDETGIDPEEAIPEILEKAFNMESDPDALRVIHDSIAYFVDKRELLVLCNNTNFPHRPEYSAEVPDKNKHTIT